MPGSQLEAELLSAREDLRITIEQMEAANEELKASNEEIRSINEELQASNEELETSKEELQSLNEELNTTNNQLQAKVEELEVRTNDLTNLFNSTDVATLFLDRALCIRWFTPSMKALLELLPSDVGRPIAHFAQRFSGGDLLEDARKVLERLLPSDTEVVDDLGRWYIRHIVPYRTEDDRIDGVVVTFTEITERKRREKEVNEAKEFAETIVQAVRFPLVVLTPELRVRSANAAFYETFQVSPDVTEGRPLAQLGNLQWDIPELHQRLSRVLPERREFSDFEIEHEFERIGRRTMLLHARPLDGAQLILLGMVDLTERKRGERERELLARELNHRVKNTLAVVQALAMQTDHSRSVEEYRDYLRRAPLGAGARAQPVARCGVARRGSQAAGRAGARGVPERPPGYDRDRGRAGAAQRHPEPWAEPDPARAGHQRRQVRRAVARGRARARFLAGRGASRRAGACACAGWSEVGPRSENLGRRASARG